MTDTYTVCVFCGSSEGSNPRYVETAAEIGRGIGACGYRLLYGGGGVGLMGAVARAARDAGSDVVGIMPKFLRGHELPPDWEYSLILTDSMQQRKAQMLAQSDAFVVLPGGVGTMDEFFEILTEASLGRLTQPILLVDVDSYFAPLLTLLRHMVEHALLRPECLKLVQTVPSAAEALQLLAQETEPQLGLRAGE